MSGGGAPPPPASFQMPNQTQAANNAYDAIGGMEAMPNFPQQTYDAYAPGATQQISQPTGYNPADTVAMGNNISRLPQEYLPYVRDMMAEGFNDNNEVYGRAAHNLTEQVRSGLGVRGLASGPYGAGVENQAMSDFNLDWQDRQLDRMTSAFGAALPGFATAGQQMGYGQDVAQGAGRYQANLADMLSVMGDRNYAQPQRIANSWLSYTDRGTAADSVEAQNYATQINAYQAEQEAEAAMWSAIGNLAGQATGAALGKWG